MRKFFIAPLHFIMIPLWLFLFPGYAPAQEAFAKHYNATYITMDEGLPANFIEDIFQDSQGFIWLSLSGGGLSRYDGYEFIHFNSNTSHRKLKSNFVHCAREDRFHRLWVSSEGGVDFIDLRTLQATRPDKLKGFPAALLNSPASHIEVDAEGCIWMHDGNRLHRIAFTSTGNIESIHSLSHTGLQKSKLVFKDIEQKGMVWISLNGQICRVSPQGEGRLQAAPVSRCLNFGPNITFSDFIIKEHEVWIASGQGLYRYDRNNDVVKHYEHVPGDPNSLSQNFLTALAVTENKQLIVGTLCGLNIYNPLKDNFEQIRNDLPGNRTTLLNSNFVNCIATEGRHIWIGTESGGINLLSPKRLALQNFRYDKENTGSLSHNPVNAIYEDEAGTLWVGTVEGGLNRKAKGSHNFQHYTNENGSLSHNSVSALTADTKGRLWVGTWGGGINLLNKKEPQRRLQTLTPDNCDNYPIFFIGSLTYDSINNGIWVGANEGLYFYDLKQEKMTTPLPDSISRNIHGCIGSVIDHSGHLWIGCLEGTYIIDLHSPQRSTHDRFRYRHLKYKLDQPESGLVEKIVCFHQSEDGTLWIGSNGCGFYRRIVETDGKERFEAYTTDDGLPNNMVRTILEDDKGHLWLATNNGLACFLPEKKHFINFTKQDGLDCTQFYWNAACHSTDNLLYFGHVTGMVAIHPDLPSYFPTQPAPLRFTRLWAGNEEVHPGKGVLPQDLPFIREISIHESLQSFSLEFSALNYEPEHAGNYSYRLIGFDKQWIPAPANHRFARYTNLSPGKYTLQVKYTPYQEGGKEQTTELGIFVKPYFYKTAWFILLVIAATGIIVWQFYQWRVRNLKRYSELLHRKVEHRTRELEKQKLLLEGKTEELSRQNKLLTEQNEKISMQKAKLAELAHKVHTLTLDKIAFFTNITHEFRTPITLIIGPIERALKLSYNPQVIEQLQFVERNSKYLLSLINQLMDFRKIESGTLKIVNVPGDFGKFVNELAAPFAVFARERNIDLRFYSRLSESRLNYDEEAMQKVLTNLLSNAIKFTPDGGSVSLFIARIPKTEKREESLYISISDSGSGIPPEDHEKIFNRFYQVRNQPQYPMYGQSGSGIGLYLCRRIVQAMNGDIEVRNNRTAGCTFRLLIPISSSPTAGVLSSDGKPNTSDVLIRQADSAPKRFNILVAEDNPDMRGYIRSILREKYQVTEAANGAEALNVLTSQHVDFIVSDLMMPVMDGIELSRRIKENLSISHIPFLMLTARTSQEARIESYRIGVDEYLLKPFDETLLLTRIENILEARKRYQRKFAASMDPEALHISEESGDKKFISRIMEAMKTRYKDPTLEVGDLSEAAGVSKSLLNQKLQSLMGQSPNQFIRSYRLNLARELILKTRETKSMNIAEIAYEVGFNDPKYFSRCFAKEFNISPGALLSEQSRS
ncbi:hybrid sensor histidine kinase/response regulator transcription factor [Bacteroides zoogleoformans]|uniref:histidine kinase n=1 Tax=Bacteroides zoogleoformans TaxID=28119 RepID=A0ABN5IM67_9BACE|nr:hybrid sensor histidine kinase/response regulator transcription factor [Bacteroides zoogleoformans]AVM53937.1 hybrid sensor histidine kinase/response regulator [Bacteroides zoogleoformans]